MSEANLVAAQAYEEALVTTLFGPWASRAVEVANPMPGEAILDLACGTGIGLSNVIRNRVRISISIRT